MATYEDPKYPGVTFRVEAEQDLIEVRGNAMASGDAKADREAEDEILRRLDSGDIWAWASVTVRATISAAGTTFEGTDSLGGCNYADEADFVKPGGYFDDMKAQAVADLRTAIALAVDRGNVGARILEQFDKGLGGEPRTSPDVDPTVALASFTLDSLSVALDCSPGADDDYLYQHEGVLLEKFADTSRTEDGGLTVTLDDGREFRINVTVTEVTGNSANV